MPRPKGYAAWNPRPEVEVLLLQVDSVLEEYRAHLPLTVRQIFYRLVGAFGYEKTEKSYKRLCEYLVRARRARRIPFDSIRDDGTKQGSSTGYYTDVADFVEGLKQAPQGYSRVLMADQDVRVEIWCEAAGMLPQLARVAENYGILVYSTGGFSSVTVTYEIGMRAARSHRPTHLLHIGDFDPSGVSLYEAMVEDAALFCAGHRGPRLVSHRVALTEEQVEEHGIPTAPPKSSDTRSVNWFGETAQAEAMPPDLLASTLREAIEDVVDVDRIAATKRRERREIDRMQELLDEVDWSELETLAEDLDAEEEGDDE